MSYIAIPAKKYNRIKIKGDTMKTFIKVNTKKSKALADYKKAKAEHKAQIKTLKAEIKRAKSDIKRHKLLIKQAKNTYKLSKV